ncbi:methylene-fatty-acyl-phospholipid synthase [Kwoniella heveanensis CBS 569]|nr:methylene-fatty-acyl-phospholipid synthase [Kwoniella heveanensis CBS 569]
MSFSKQLAHVLDDLPPWVPFQDLFNPSYHYATVGVGAGVGRYAGLVDLSKKSLWAFVAQVAFNPIFWNYVARNEYRKRTITKIVGSPLIGTYLLAVTIFSISAFRDHLYLNAVKDQPAYLPLAHPGVKALAAALFLAGQTFVISSMWALGVTGTYLGDYFGILMTHRVTSFPFNVLSDPMYVGSALSHLGTALWFQSPVGIVLSAWVWLVYVVALRFEGPFTDKIYSSKSKKTDALDEPNPSASSTATAYPATPSRRSGRIAARKSISASDFEVDSSDADADAPSTSAFTSTKSGRKSRSSALKDELNAAAGSGSGSGSGRGTPSRMTRSRSKGRVSEVDTD